jgi:hypothetical protein
VTANLQFLLLKANDTIPDAALSAIGGNRRMLWALDLAQNGWRFDRPTSTWINPVAQEANRAS